ncbi:MAG: M56 family metallopeptidase [Planctomycetota bacterium]
MNPTAEFLVVNGLFGLTLWLLVPIALAAILGRRYPQMQRKLVRLTLVTLPVPILAALCGWGGARSLVAWSPPTDNGPGTVTYATVDGDEGFDPSVEFAAAEPVPHPAFFVTPPVAAGEATTDRAAATVESGPPATTTVSAAATPPAVTPRAVPQSVPTATEFAWSRLLVLLWGVGCVFAATRLLSALLRLRQLRRGWTETSRPLTQLESQLVLRAHELAHELGVRRRFQVHICDQLGEAVAAGFSKPAIVVPRAWVATLQPSQLEPLLLHEVAHLKSRDPLWRTLTTVGCALLWPHPAMHWLRRRETLLSELIADRHVVGHGQDRKKYARLLGTLAGALRPAQPPIAIAPGVLGQTSQLERRIQMILTSPLGAAAPLRSAAVAVCTLLFLTLVATHPLLGEDVDKDPVRVQVEQQGSWWVARGHLDGNSDDLCWVVRLCPTKDGSNVHVVADKKSKVTISVGAHEWHLDRLTGQILPAPAAPSLLAPPVARFPAAPPSPTEPPTAASPPVAPNRSVTGSAPAGAPSAFDRAVDAYRQAAEEAAEKERQIHAHAEGSYRQLHNRLRALDPEIDLARRELALAEEQAAAASLQRHLAQMRAERDEIALQSGDLKRRLDLALTKADQQAAKELRNEEANLSARLAELNAQLRNTPDNAAIYRAHRDALEALERARAAAEFPRSRSRRTAEALRRDLQRSEPKAPRTNPRVRPSIRSTLKPHGHAPRRPDPYTRSEPLRAQSPAPAPVSDAAIKQLLEELRAIRQEVKELRGEVEQNRQSIQHPNSGSQSGGR